MTVLVTGGCGFIGSTFVRMWHERHLEDRIIVLDALTYAGDLRNLDGPQPFSLVQGDIADVALVRRVFRVYRPDTVVHFAAETHVDRSIADPLAHVRTNVLGTAALVEAAREAKVERFLHVSTDEVYGSLGLHDAPFTEGSPIRPNSPYAASKAAADHLVLAAHRTYGFPAIITRCTNNYGPRQHPEKLIPTAILRALAGQAIPVYGDGKNVRDWIRVEDHCAALEVVLARGALGEVYNIGAEAPLSNLVVARRICDLVGKGSIEHVTDRPGHDFRYAVNTNKLRALGWTTPRYASFVEGLRGTVDWYRDNEPWWRPILTSASHEKWVTKNYQTRG